MKTIEEQVKVEADERYSIMESANDAQGFFIAGASFAIPLAERRGIQKTIDYLMNNAGNYCTCTNAGKWCDKHAQTFSADILSIEFGILPGGEGQL